MKKSFAGKNARKFDEDNAVHFKSYGEDIKHCNIEISEHINGHLIVIEDSSTKEKWQTVLTDSETQQKCEIIPSKVILEALKKAFECSKTQFCFPSKTDEFAPLVYLVCFGNEMEALLSLSLSGLYRVEMEFLLEKVQNSLDTSEKCNQELNLRTINDRLITAEVKLNNLSKSTMTSPIFINVASDTPINAINLIEWGSEYPRDINDDYFELSDDNTTITVKQSGIYHIILKVTQCNGHGYGIELLCDGIELGICYDNSKGSIASVLMSEIFTLSANSKLQVRSGLCESGISNNPLTNKFTILKL